MPINLCFEVEFKINKGTVSGDGQSCCAQFSYNGSSSPRCGSLLQHLNELRQRPCSMSYVADLLAKRAIHSDFDMHIVSTPDATLRQLMLSDMDAHADRVE
ncbi:hypothetical protein V6N13_051216 [Hibiscus sabdariffa]|uniref:Uncharacterized protein n=1 Tax=Hibiscus sabdariffa TaxID=183260 RepID=A0ABR2T357_9ROSI